MLYSFIVVVELALYYFLLEVPANERLPLLASYSLLVSAFFTPLIVVSGLAHVARSYDVTVFEISLLASWKNVAYARAASLSGYVTPYAVLEALMTYIIGGACKARDPLFLAVSFLVSIYVYSGLSLLVSLIGGKRLSIMLSSALVFLLPISAMVLVSNYRMFNASLGVFESIIVSIFNSGLAYLYTILQPKLISISPASIIAINIALAILFYLIFIELFIRLEVKP